MGKHNNGFTLEENLALTNDELMSNWTKLASFVLTYEKNISWESARAKAGHLLKEGLAVAYIETARKNPAGMPESKPDVVEPNPKVATTVKPTSATKTVYQENFARLLKIAPGIETRLLKASVFKGDEVYGKSEATGYMNFSLELISQDADNYYVAISHHHIQNGDMIADPDMLIRVDLKKKIVEALTYQDSFGFKQVYEDYTDRSVVNTRQRKGQNAFLTTWLKNLKTQGHKIQWKERATTGVVDSELIVQYERQAEVPAISMDEIKAAPAKEPELKQETKGNAPSTYTEMERKEIISAIKLMNTSIKQSEAERKADEYQKTGKAPNFLLKVIQRQIFKNKDDLYMFNYYKLVFLAPDILQKLSNTDALVKLVSKGNDTDSEYEITQGEVQSDKIQFIVHEYSDSSGVGVLVLNVKPKNNMIWVRHLAQNFNSQNDFNEQEAEFSKRYKVDQWLNQWLNKLIGLQYIAVWKGETPESDMQEIVPIMSEEPIKEDPLAEYKKRAEEIPDFEVGKVQLVDAHLKAGITQKHIDWINEHQQGMVITPRRKPMIQNTKDKVMDKAIHAMKPGFRISATGKLYYEGRSNRSDKRNTGL